MTSFKFALRSLLKSPGFTLVAVLTLTLGIGANTAMFSLLNTLVLRPLPYAESDELVRVWRASEQDQRGSSAPADFFDLRTASAGTARFSAFLKKGVAVAEPGQPAASKELMGVSADFFDLLRVQPERGRNFRTEEEIHGNHRVLLVSHAYWQSDLGGGADVIGSTLRIDGEPHEIIGILPDWATERRPLDHAALYRPLGLTDDERTSRTQTMLSIIGRRDLGVGQSQLETHLVKFGNDSAKTFPDTHANISWRSESLASSAMNPIGRMIVFMLLGLSGSVLLIACSNLANFLLARTIARSRELAVRAALGASRWHLIGPLAAESLLIAITGGTFALLVCQWMTSWLSAESAKYGDTALHLPLDWRVLAFAFAAAVFTALFFGVVPALFAMRIDLNDTLKSGSRGATAGRGHQRLRSLLVVGQFTLALVILSSAGFFIRGARNMIEQDYGWSTAHVVQGRVELPRARYSGGPEILAFQQQVIERLGALPGVTAVSFSYNVPYVGLPGPRGYLIEGHKIPERGREPTASYNGISDDYFTVTGTRLVQGRTFARSDSSAAPRVTIISESFARALFPGENAIGRRIARADAKTPEWTEIVGVVADVRSVLTTEKPNLFQVYHPIAQEPWHSSRFAVRTTGANPESLIAPIRQAIAELNPDLPVIELTTAEQQFVRTASDLFLINHLLGGFALLAVALAALGIYGVIARTVAQRAGEFGIRLALGAQVGNIVGLVLKLGLRLAVIGVALGLLGSWGMARVLASGLPGLDTSSTPVMAAVTAALITIALLACYLPARKAAKINPIDALRSE